MAWMQRESISAAPLVVILISVALLGSVGCSWMNRGGPTELFRSSFFPLGAPVISGYDISDPETNCPPGKTEQDRLVTWGRTTFTPSFGNHLDQVKLPICFEPGGKRYFITLPPITILQTGTVIDTCEVDQINEYDQVGSRTVVAGSCVGGDNAIFLGLWNAGMVTWSLGPGTGTTFSDASTLQFYTGFAAAYDGVDLSAAFTYADNLGRLGLGWCTHATPSWNCQRLTLASELGKGAVAVPTIGHDCAGETAPGAGCASPAGLFVSFYAGAVPSIPDVVYQLTVTPTLGSAIEVARVGDAVPDVAGDTFASFGGLGSLASGNQWSAFAGTTSPSSSNVLFRFSMASGLDSAPTFATGDPIPGMEEAAAQIDALSFYRNRLSFRTAGLSLRAAYLTEADDGEGGRARVGIARESVDMSRERELASIYPSRSSIYDGTAVLGADFTSLAGLETGISAYDVSLEERAHGSPSALYGTHGQDGVINITTQNGFDITAAHSVPADLQSATFFGDRLLFGTATAELYEWDHDLDAAVLLGATGASSLYGLAADTSGNLWGSSLDTFYSIDPITWLATEVGPFEDAIGTPINDIRGLSGVADGIGAARGDGTIFHVDTGTAVLTEAVTIEGLASVLDSFTTDRQDRFFGGLQDGRFIELVDWDAHGNGGAPAELIANGPAPTPSVGFVVMGDAGNGPVTGVVAVPEPAALLAQLCALVTLAALAAPRGGRQNDGRNP
jgi:hypothetical protein